MPFRWVREDLPGSDWARAFQRSWPSYRRWFLAEGDERRPGSLESRAALERHMPELVPVWERLVHLAGGDDQAARMLALYRPTPYLFGCSQALWTRGEPALVRNYDYHPSACEGTFLLSRWGATRVLAASDCLWGALDGMNEHGLVVALAFGGRRVVGDGFGLPLVLRYVLETCRTTAEAVAVLTRVPSHMAYNVSVLDAEGTPARVALAPDRAPEVSRAPVATNHQPGNGWSAHDAWTRTAEREHLLSERLADPGTERSAFIEGFLREPLYAREYQRAFGTLYTAVYFPARRAMQVLWPGEAVTQELDDFRERTLVVSLSARTG